MKIPIALTALSLSFLVLPSCDRDSPETARMLAELERRNQEAVERQAELERQLADQKLAAELEAIERERAWIEEDRAELERQAGEAGQVASAQEEELRRREAEMAAREVKVDALRVSLEEKENSLGTREQELTDRDREMAGREALNPEESDPGEPVGDYGTFHESLSSYGSWFETPDYGYVWQPAVVREVGWRPYSRGRWVCSDRGWTWISEEPFGWATYHYGRWALLRGRGWIWVPGSEWAPSWVSWRESESHVGWAPLPPETLGWRGNGWDNTVDVRFGIGASWFTFVAVRNFGSPLYGRCLPVSGNIGWYGSTTNVTYIHGRKNQVICGGPRYDRICERIGRPVPFYRLDVDRHPRFGRNSGGLRPEVRGGRLRVSAPNLNADWNDGLRPSRVRGRIDQVMVERDRNLDAGISERFRQSRTEGRQRAEKIIQEQGGRERFEEMRRGKMIPGQLPDRGKSGGIARQDSVGRADMPKRGATVQPGRLPDRGKSGGIARQESAARADLPKREEAVQPGRVNVAPKPLPANRLPDGVTRRSDSKSEPVGRVLGSGANKNQPEIVRGGGEREKTTPGRKAESMIAPPPPPTGRDDRSGRVGSGERTDTKREASRKSEIPDRQRQDATGQQKQRNQDEARKSQEEDARRQQTEQARQRQQLDNQRREEQSRAARQQALEKQERQQKASRDEAMRQQQEKQQRQQAAEKQRQRQQDQDRQKAEQQRQRQQDQARQRDADQQRQRQQDQERQQQAEKQRQRQQDQARQQQADQQRQRQQDQSRQQEQSRRQEQSRQEEKRSQDNSGKRNR